MNRCVNNFGLGILFGFLVLATGTTMAAGPPIASDLVPHRALYRMTLGSTTSGSGIIGVRGAMLYRFANGCDGWIGETKTYLRLQYGDGPEIETVWTFANWESFDGLSYRFRLRQSRNGRPVENLQGTAYLEEKGQAGEARYTLPEETTVPLPAGSLFPTEHLLTLFQAAHQGVVQDSRVVFDGSSLDNPFEISTVIGAIPPAENAKNAEKAGLDVVPSWGMRMAFFPLSGGGALPEFEVGVRYREDGIADRIEQDFGEFSVDLILGELELLPMPDC